MNDLSTTIIPKSDQLNADDLIVGPKTITVNSVKLLSGDQPVSIGYVGDGGKPYKPCKSMRRVLVSVWGSNGNDYIGKSMTVYNDPDITFGKNKVGGIRISHMSHIDQPVTIALTVSRANRKPYTIHPLIKNDDESRGLDAANNGTEELKRYWEGLSVSQRKKLQPFLEGWKVIASEHDNNIGCESK